MPDDTHIERPDTRIAVAMSGGVDSSVAAVLLAEAGRDVFGVTMILGAARSGDADDVAHARRACDMLGIEHVTIDVSSAFESLVTGPFCDAYAAGLTPNPCVWCNATLKLGVFAERVFALGAGRLATGHYARLTSGEGGVWLERAADAAKDQSYFLYRVPPEMLARIEFPLGGLTKAEVRAMAADRSLPAAEHRESQEICFTHDHVGLVTARHPEAGAPGPIEDLAGTVLGTHRGIAHYTVGQRRGIGLAGPGGPYRVLQIDVGRHAVIVGPEASLARREVVLADAIWRIEGAAHVSAQVRYRSAPVPAEATPEADGLRVAFEQPITGLAPGQSVALYHGPRVVGGGYVPHA
ncbi:MAG: tRNA 2-thiouridine(34) synthase MnmA [Coriobacteriia bacterium]|nr:tRNA 2-thiouridine(34) synthase MnmA [Coriobacteriia bacterium]